MIEGEGENLGLRPGAVVASKGSEGKLKQKQSPEVTLLDYYCLDPLLAAGV
jgi:hypothetical protein